MPRRTSEVVIEIVTGDLTTELVDAIVLKHAVEALFGAEIAVDRKLGGLISATFADRELDPTGDSVCLPGKGISANYVLLVAVGSLYELTYKGVDVLARNMIQALSRHLPQADSFATTVHGPGIGLDPAECLKSQLLGFASALRRIDSPPPLSRIAIVEHEPFIAQLLTQSLDSFSKAHPDVLIKIDEAYRRLLPSRGGAVEQVRFAALREPTIFVAMPFSKQFRNIYDYGIRLPILTVERKPIRIDDEHFNGSVIAKVKEHIRSSEMVIADMTGANPNVFFEVGFAEGVGKRTVLLCQDPGSLPFDVRGDVHVVYDPESIHDLEEKLTEHLRILCS
jgi:hypothetical protein